MSNTNKSASFTTSRAKQRAVFGSAVIAQQAIINGTNNVNTKSFFGTPVGASLVINEVVGATETSPAEYNAFVASVPTLPYVPGPAYYLILDSNNVLVGYTGTLPAVFTIPTYVDSRLVSSIAAGLFAGVTSLVNVTINPGGAYDSLPDNLFNGCPNLTTVSITGITSIGNSIFQSCSALTTVTLPTSLTSIGSGAFNYCTALTSITIPALITSLPDSCFGNCRSLATVSLPSGLLYIGNFTFAACTGLITIAIPTSVNYINSFAFNSSGLLSITFGSLTPPTFGSNGDRYTESYTFGGVSNSAVMYIPNAANNATWVAAVTLPNVQWTGTVVNLP